MHYEFCKKTGPGECKYSTVGEQGPGTSGLGLDALTLYTIQTRRKEAFGTYKASK